MGWADHVCVGCPGRRFGHFGVRGRFHDCWRSFVFLSTSVGRRQRGGGQMRTVVFKMLLHHSILDVRWREGMVDDGGGDEERRDG